MDQTLTSGLQGFVQDRIDPIFGKLKTDSEPFKKTQFIFLNLLDHLPHIFQGLREILNQFQRATGNQSQTGLGQPGVKSAQDNSGNFFLSLSIKAPFPVPGLLESGFPILGLVRILQDPFQFLFRIHTTTDG